MKKWNFNHENFAWRRWRKVGKLLIRTANFLFRNLTSLVGLGLIYEFPRSHSDTPRSVRLPGRVISPAQIPLPDNIQQTNIHAPVGIRIHNSTKQAATDPHLRPRGHWNKKLPVIQGLKFLSGAYRIQSRCTKLSNTRYILKISSYNP